jgi:hypothetical protein
MVVGDNVGESVVLVAITDAACLAARFAVFCVSLAYACVWMPAFAGMTNDETTDGGMTGEGTAGGGMTDIICSSSRRRPGPKPAALAAGLTKHRETAPAVFVTLLEGSNRENFLRLGKLFSYYLSLR